MERRKEKCLIAVRSLSAFWSR